MRILPFLACLVTVGQLFLSSNVFAQYANGPGVGVSANYGNTAAPLVRGGLGTDSISQTSETYTITALDGLQFRIVGELETATEVRVAGDGSVTLPYVGTVKLAGKTVSEARQYLYELYDKDWYVNPQIDLLVVSYSQRRVQVLGRVGRQGPVVFPPEEKMTLITAISYAGGWDPQGLSRKTDVTVTRKEGGVDKVYTIDVTKSGKDFDLKDGDTIFVPERIF
ncbi:MAG: polysaccharide biosynthesis/export family protein [Verrucomicrobiota bacterium]|nr:polysaccharide biosynthesis/export family protein [Verrucomicrobiota bacterium]